ncbi:M48 family metallopeptidase [Clostridium niameyense]|uniref:M48 family metallopeptidase n=1 Tax=Clostridium niameyense TaxID=1622073 RepID=A0A6M0RBN0_9CLOT|nr:M48 family metallopeptidase [Clostridium niameyense]NEZ47197.1 M48 family metallopeptidase [Clostridium niameyense]
MGDIKGYYYLGKLYPCEIKNKKSVYCDLELKKEKFYIYINEGILEKYKKDIINQSIEKFYKVKAYEILEQRTKYYGNKIGYLPNKITVKSQRTLWGSCSSKKNINYNYRLIMAPINIIDYIVVHELCHLKHMNHSKDFWNMVEGTIVNYKERRKWLKENGSKLFDYKT